MIVEMMYKVNAVIVVGNTEPHMECVSLEGERYKSKK